MLLQDSDYHPLVHILGIADEEAAIDFTINAAREKDLFNEAASASQIESKTSSQRATVVAKFYEWYAANHEIPNKRVVLDQLGDAFGIGYQVIWEALCMLKFPEVFQQIERGELKCHAAYMKYGGPKAKRGNPRSTIDAPIVTNSKAERIEHIRRLANEGFNSIQIGAQLGIAEQRIRKLARDNDIEVRADIVQKQRKRVINVDKIIDESIIALQGIAASLEMIDERLNELDPIRADRLYKPFFDAIYDLQKFAAKIKRRAIP